MIYKEKAEKFREEIEDYLYPIIEQYEELRFFDIDEDDGTFIEEEMKSSPVVSGVSSNYFEQAQDFAVVKVFKREDNFILIGMGVEDYHQQEFNLDYLELDELCVLADSVTNLIKLYNDDTSEQSPKEGGKGENFETN